MPIKSWIAAALGALLVTGCATFTDPDAQIRVIEGRATAGTPIIGPRAEGDGCVASFVGTPPAGTTFKYTGEDCTVYYRAPVESAGPGTAGGAW